MDKLKLLPADYDRSVLILNRIIVKDAVTLIQVPWPSSFLLVSLYSICMRKVANLTQRMFLGKKLPQGWLTGVGSAHEYCALLAERTLTGSVTFLLSLGTMI